MEPPECPVCLQSYDGVDAIPRVLACGHTACENCLLGLPAKFPHTIRCPACTQIVKYPPQGPSSLPKNIDLLRLADAGPNPQKPQNRYRDDRRPVQQFDFIPSAWSPEFYALWKQYVIPHDALVVEQKSEEYSGLCFGCFRDDGGSQRVSLVKVGSTLLSGNNDDDSSFKYSYFVRVMRCLSSMRDGERDELSLMLRTSIKETRIRKVLGLWADIEDGNLYMVCQRLNHNLSEKFGYLKTDDGYGLFNNELSCFALMGMEMCEVLSCLNKQGFIAGFFGFSSFDFDDFGHLYADLSDILVVGRNVVKSAMELGAGGTRVGDEEFRVFLSDLLKGHVFLSPELLFELLTKEGIDFDRGDFRFSVGYGSDVWSLACILLQLLLGKQFTKEYIDYVHCDNIKANEEKSLDCLGPYTGLIGKISSLLENKFGTEFVVLQRLLCQCFNLVPGNRPLVTDVWKHMRELIVKPELDKMIKLGEVAGAEDKSCIVLGELCRISKGSLRTHEKDELPTEETSDGTDTDIIKGLRGGSIRFKDLKGHLDCVSGLAIGGEFLLSCSFDKTVRVWSLQDYSHVHTFKGHEHRVMAVVYADGEKPVCISGDSGGVIFMWSISVPLGQEPLKKWNEQKDWRFSGIHALAVSERYLYTGSGDKTVKAWLLQDGTLFCTMIGHKSVVSTLAICNGILYSGSWDGTIGLWSLADHSLLTLLEEDRFGNMSTIFSLSANLHTLVAAYENGSIKIWRNDVFMKSTQTHKGTIFSTCMEGQWLFTGGWDKIVIVQELTGDDAEHIGSIPCDSVITALSYWQGKLFVGHADKTVKVYYYGK